MTSKEPGLAVVTGALGQDGMMLCASLRSRKYPVIAVARPGTGHPERRRWLSDGLGCRIVDIDLRQPRQLGELVASAKPDTIFHLAAVHHSSIAVAPTPEYWRSMVAVNFGVLEELLNVVAANAIDASLVFASSSQIWTPHEVNQRVSEETPVNPSSFYGHTKVWSSDLLRHFRQHFGLRASIAVLFNHESPLRSPSFVTRKITMAAARAAGGDTEPLRLGNIGASVDWQAAADVINALMAMSEAATPDDYILASGIGRPVKDFLSVAYEHVGLDWRKLVVTDGDDPVPSLVGKADKAARALHWRPTWTFEQLVKTMVDADMASAAYQDGGERNRLFEGMLSPP